MIFVVNPYMESWQALYMVSKAVLDADAYFSKKIIASL
jgi:hypothetical protein